MAPFLSGLWCTSFPCSGSLLLSLFILHFCYCTRLRAAALRGDRGDGFEDDGFEEQEALTLQVV